MADAQVEVLRTQVSDLKRDLDIAHEKIRGLELDLAKRGTEVERALSDMRELADQMRQSAEQLARYGEQIKTLFESKRGAAAITVAMVAAVVGGAVSFIVNLLGKR